MKVLVINGPNLNLLGIREPSIYGNKSYKDLVSFIKKTSLSLNVKVKCFQSNYEGKIVSVIQKSYRKFDAIIINPAAFTHTSIAILDALKAVGLPCVEVHLSDIKKREDFRQFSYISLYAFKTITGLGFQGYKIALEEIKNHFGQTSAKDNN